MTERPDHLEVLLDAVLTGDATADQRADHERMLREDASYRASFEAQSRIESALRRWSQSDGAGVAPVAPVVGVARPSRRWKPLALAAALALAGLAAVIAWRVGLLPGGGGSGGGGGTNTSPYARLTPEGIYREAAAGNFTPAWRCETDQQFIDAVVDKLRRPILLPIATPGVEIVGWSYSDVTKPAVSSGSMWLYVNTADGPTVVIVDRLDRERTSGRLAAGGAPEFRSFRREIGGLVLYEITKGEAPRVIEHFVVPDAG